MISCLVLERAGTAQDGRFVVVLLEPAAHLGAVLGLLRCVVEIHAAAFTRPRWLTRRPVSVGSPHSARRW